MRTLVFCLSLCLLSLSSLAQSRSKVAAPAPAPAAPLTAKEALSQARKLYDSLEYDKVAPLAATALAAPDVTLDDKLIAYQLQGSALAIIGDPTDAERPFLLLLSVRQDFALPEDTPPKIKSVFAKVKGEFDEVRRADEARQRRELAATIEIVGLPPAQAVGGRALRFEFGVTDPRGVVKSVRVQYRKKGESEFLALPLARDVKTGQWAAAVPGEWTASPTPFAMDVVLTVADATGPLRQLGDPVPLAIEVLAGEVDRSVRPVPLWVFGTSIGVTTAALVTSGALAGVTAWQNADYHQKLEASKTGEPAVGRDIVEQQNRGNALNVAQAVGWGAVGVGGLVSGVLAIFTNWSGDEATEPTAPTEPTQPTPAPTPVAMR